jgi:serine/threonine protein kinase
LSKRKKVPVVAARDSFPSPKDLFSPGTTIDNRFRIVARLSKGPRGPVYVAEHAILEGRLAIRILHDTKSFGDDLEERFLEEAKTLARLNHKHIVKLFDAGVTSNGYLFATMELLEGLTFDKWRLNKSDPDFDSPGDERFMDALLGYMRQIADGVLESHENGICHHNLKPSNIFLHETERAGAFLRIPKLIDFGHLKKKPDCGGTLVDNAYRAPEIRNGGAGGVRADIFSLGVIFYEMLTGALPHEAVDDAEQGDVDGKIIPPSVKNPYVTKKLDQLVMKAMAWHEADRYTSMYDLVEDFDAALVVHNTRVTTDTEISPGMIPLDRDRRVLKVTFFVLAAVIVATVGVGAVLVNRLGTDVPTIILPAQSPPHFDNTGALVPDGIPPNPAVPAVLDASTSHAAEDASDRVSDGGRFSSADLSTAAETMTSARGALSSSHGIPADDAPLEGAEGEAAMNRDRLAVRRMMKQANQAMDEKHWKKAQSLFEAVIDLNPVRADAWAGLSRAAFQRKLFDDAIAHVKQALAIRDKPGWRMLLGQYQDRRGDKKDAIDTWRTVLSDFPNASDKTKRDVKKMLKEAGAI